MRYDFSCLILKMGALLIRAGFYYNRYAFLALRLHMIAIAVRRERRVMANDW
jgi:hypothetical protein